MSQLKIYKASAGSGKTFRLAVDYLKLILKNEYAYRHILAVTFTNKATAEMKSRILSELHELSIGKQTAYLDVLKIELGMHDWEIAQKASQVLKKILHDYSRFSISTIDSFFQRVIKAFNRELGINSAYNVELDENAVLNEAVDRLILSIEEDKRLHDWLKEFAESKIREGRGWNLKTDMVQLGKEIYNDSFRSLNEELYLKLNDHRFISEYKSELQKIIHQFQSTLKSYGNGGMTIISENNLSVDDFKRKVGGPANSFRKLTNGDYSFTATAIKAASDIEEWYAKTADAAVKTTSEQLMKVLQHAVQYFQSHVVDYNTARLINDQLYTLGILVDLRKMVKEICHEKGLVLISDSGHFIRQIIEESETPFIYEKTGVVYNHFMIDEFQDTSRLQWENFRPLILNSMSEDNFNLVVGDVKQAIYRWRKGDWNLLAGELHHSLGAFTADNVVLDQNWRSCGNIIRLNNTIFSLAPRILQRQYESDLQDAGLPDDTHSMPINEIYEGHIQEIAKRELDDEGYFRIKFLEASRGKTEENEQLIKSELVSEIKKLQSRGVAAKEIAILVRSKMEAKTIAELFLAEKNNPENEKFNFDILSNESLYLNNSQVVGFIVALMQFYIDVENPIVVATLNHLYYSYLQPILKDQGLSPEFNLNEINGQTTLNFKTLYTPVLSGQFEDLANEDNVFIHFLKEGAFHQMVSGKSLQEMVYGICEKFFLFNIKDELAYLQAFIDQLAGFERNNASEVTSFLNWWEDNSANVTIPVSDSIDAISVLTIHKAKGLEFNHVFVPYCDWKLEPKTGDKAPLLWCQPTKKPFDMLELVPVKYKKELAISIFSREYFLEKFNTYVDNLNLIYVALTRARSGIYLWPQTTGKLDTIGDLLKESIFQSYESSQNVPSLAGSFNENEQLLEFGRFFNPEKKTVDLVESRIIDEFEFSDFRKHLSIRKNTEDFFDAEGKPHNAVNKGKIIHEILAGITHRDELKDSIKMAVFSGKISSKDTDLYYSEISEMLNAEAVSSWFDGTYKVVNERSILSHENMGTKRPDRMMFHHDELIVVDYKSGILELEKHQIQLRTYISLLKQCGYLKVKGYLWYTKNNKLVEV